MPLPSVVFGDVHGVTAKEYSIIKWKYAFDSVLLMLKTVMGFNESYKINVQYFHLWIHCWKIYRLHFSCIKNVFYVNDWFVMSVGFFVCLVGVFLGFFFCFFVLPAVAHLVMKCATYTLCITWKPSMQFLSWPVHRISLRICSEPYHQRPTFQFLWSLIWLWCMDITKVKLVFNLNQRMILYFIFSYVSLDYMINV